MKLEELEVGKWYKSKDWAPNSYAKFLNSNNGYFNYSESIYNNKFRAQVVGPGVVCFFGEIWGLVEEVTIEEITNYLPHDHPDRFQPIIINDSYESLIKLLQKLDIK